MRYIVFAGALVNIVLTFSYIREVFRGSIQPNRISWLMWAVAPLIATAAALTNGVGLAVVPVFMSGFTPLLIFTISFINSKAYWKLSRTDYYCGFMSLLALVIWHISRNPNYAIVFAILSDGFAAIPTLVKSWRHPDTENATAYIGGLLLALSSFFAIEIWNFSSLAFPIYLVVVNIFVIIAIKQKLLKKMH